MNDSLYNQFVICIYVNNELFMEPDILVLVEGNYLHLAIAVHTRKSTKIFDIS